VNLRPVIFPRSRYIFDFQPGTFLWFIEKLVRNFTVSIIYVHLYSNTYSVTTAISWSTQFSSKDICGRVPIAFCSGVRSTTDDFNQNTGKPHGVALRGPFTCGISDAELAYDVSCNRSKIRLAGSQVNDFARRQSIRWFWLLDKESRIFGLF